MAWLPALDDLTLALAAVASILGVLLGTLVWRRSRARERSVRASARPSASMRRAHQRSQVIALSTASAPEADSDRELYRLASNAVTRPSSVPLEAPVSDALKLEPFVDAPSAEPLPTPPSSPPANDVQIATSNHVPAPMPHAAPPSVHETPTREFAAHIEALAALTVVGAPTTELSVHVAPTRAFAAFREEDEQSTRRVKGLPAPSVALPAHLPRTAHERSVVASGIRPRAPGVPRQDEDTERVGHARKPGFKP